MITKWIEEREEVKEDAPAQDVEDTKESILEFCNAAINEILTASSGLDCEEWPTESVMAHLLKAASMVNCIKDEAETL